MQWSLMSRGEAQGFLPVGGLQDLIPKLPENGTGQFPNVRLILNHEDRLGSAKLLPDLLRLLSLLKRLTVLSGKIDLKGRLSAQSAVYKNPTATAQNDAIHRGQAESGPFTSLLGSEKGLEEMFLGFRIHANAGVGYG